MPTGVDSGGLGRATTGGYGGSETLAVLLPESGRFAGAAQAVRDGIVAAREADPQGKRPRLRFYDSAAGSIDSLLRQAVADGATLAIGPLQKSAVDRLARSSTLPIPVLALNQVGGAARPPANLYQFALSPEDEAADVALKAWDQGHRRALIMFPEGNWGSRLARAFSKAWKARGGATVATQAYDPAAEDFTDPIASLSSRSRDGDFVFLVATAQEARQLWPQLHRKLGSKVPGYATSHISGKQFDPKEDRGLVGLNFVEIPWLVEPVKEDRVSAKGLRGKLPQLYAMGVDAYRLGSRLGWLSSSAGARMLGKTGLLSMDSRGRVHRELTLVRMNTNGPVKVALGPRSWATAYARAVEPQADPPRLARLMPRARPALEL